MDSMTDMETIATVLGKLTCVVVTVDKEDQTLIARHKHGQGDVAFTFDDDDNLVDMCAEEDMK